MGLEQFKDLKEALTFLQEQGYSQSFSCCPEGWQSPETKEVFSPEDLQVEMCQRFQVYLGAHHLAVLYVVKAPNGTKGVIIDNCTTYGDALFGEFLLRMKLHKTVRSSQQPK
ncbi:hypothetical protein [Rufibacter latericius]|uniref:Uncharacterized protein n=1 Tax=Rufibacter latericius TaxID=2487040 RepID=A0A3M9MB96_9BACT|nr:hypothetical protein [Rufibacter latericius]RNI21838.1 hypothetical protein EFB08_22085 [Rufibacter latericius]